MKNYKKQRKSSISKTEYKILEKLKENSVEVFDIELVEKLTAFKRAKIHQLLSSLKKKRIIHYISRGKYFFLFPQAPDAIFLSCNILWPSYISFWTALNFYKFTEQMPRTIFLVTTKKAKSITLLDRKIVFVRLSRKRFFGYEKIDNIVIAEKEKALIDSLLLPRYAGGIEEVFKCLLNAWVEVDKRKLIEYALKMKNKSLIKRLGYLIEHGNFKIERGLLKKMEKKIGKGYSKLDTTGKVIEYNKKWKLIINVPKEKLFERGGVI